MGHTQQGLRAYSPPPQTSQQQFFVRSAFLRRKKLICHLLSYGAPVPFADRTIYLSSAGVRTSNRTSPVPSTTHSSSF
ncbi:hypothetical protein TNCV_1650091 [Trichonephila clavipes]|nr:hypothetical protein TNCV_1650091 [Trichonephila clavipes]